MTGPDPESLPMRRSLRAPLLWFRAQFGRHRIMDSVVLAALATGVPKDTLAGFR